MCKYVNQLAWAWKCHMFTTWPMLVTPTLPEMGPLNQLLLLSIFSVAWSTWFRFLIYAWGGMTASTKCRRLSLDRAGNACLGLSWLTHLVVAGSWSWQETRPWRLFLHCHPFLDHYVGKSFLFMFAYVMYFLSFKTDHIQPMPCVSYVAKSGLINRIMRRARLKEQGNDQVQRRNKSRTHENQEPC